MLRTLAAAALLAVGLAAAPSAPADTQPARPGIVSDIAMSPASQRNAVRKAQEYLSFSSFSQEGLYEQLVYEGFSQDDALYAVNSLDVDWEVQAAKKAQEYLSFSSFSEQSLYEQLVYEGFTPSQAEYGVAAAYR
jgi:SOS response regulatory protein OraA/RecX